MREPECPQNVHSGSHSFLYIEKCKIRPYNSEVQLARVAKWQTHYLEVVAPKGVEVRILSRAQTPVIYLTNDVPSGYL